MRNFNREELAWAGGLFSGEGCTAINTKSQGIQIVICQKYSPEVLYRFLNAVKIGKVYGPYNQVWSYQVSNFKDVQAIIAMLWPWLSEMKKEQATKSFRAYKSFPPKRSYVKHGTNVIEFNGKRQHVAAWSRETGVPYGTIYTRIENGWPTERLFEPSRPKRTKQPEQILQAA